MNTVFNEHLGDLVDADAAVSLGPGRVGRCSYVTFYAVFGAGVSAGELTVETSHDENYAGDWSQMDVFSFVDDGCVHRSYSAVHAAIRVRVSSAIVGGSVAIHAIGKAN